MGNTSRDYKRTTIRRLDTLSGNQCANPDCEKQLIAKDGETILSKICHIEAASPNGPRYNNKMTDDERRHYDNLILLCDECHNIIDNKENEEQYTVELLKIWKTNHETLVQQNLLIKKPMLLNQAINAIANIELDENDIAIDSKIESFNIPNKIEHNSIKRNKFLIDEYSKYYAKINSLYRELEAQGSFKKEKLLRNIHLIYIQTKGKYINGQENILETIQLNADNIIEDIENKLSEILDNDLSNTEDISFALPIIMVDAFTRCKILEEPVK